MRGPPRDGREAPPVAAGDVVEHRLLACLGVGVARHDLADPAARTVLRTDRESAPLACFDFLGGGVQADVRAPRTVPQGLLPKPHAEAQPPLLRDDDSVQNRPCDPKADGDGPASSERAPRGGATRLKDGTRINRIPLPVSACLPCERREPPRKLSLSSTRRQ